MENFSKKKFPGISINIVDSYLTHPTICADCAKNLK